MGVLRQLQGVSEPNPGVPPRLECFLHSSISGRFAVACVLLSCVNGATCASAIGAARALNRSSCSRNRWLNVVFCKPIGFVKRFLELCVPATAASANIWIIIPLASLSRRSSQNSGEPRINLHLNLLPPSSRKKLRDTYVPIAPTTRFRTSFTPMFSIFSSLTWVNTSRGWICPQACADSPTTTPTTMVLAESCWSMSPTPAWSAPKPTLQRLDIMSWGSPALVVSRRCTFSVVRGCNCGG
mmetsp:Transcript_12457/g.29202  ORF Transcript_12457/g.29202 Transcript_12457/m.29202 type:complete len:241 (-) Transcript_12457:384-1106(-)